MDGQLLAYVAYVKNLNQTHIDFLKELTERGFLTVCSNYINNSREFPNCEKDTAALVSANRYANIVIPENRFFILFVDNAIDISWIEFGIALGAKVENICLIGNKPRSNSFACADVVNVYSDVANFFACRFFN